MSSKALNYVVELMFGCDRKPLRVSSCEVFEDLGKSNVRQFQDFSETALKFLINLSLSIEYNWRRRYAGVDFFIRS